MKNIRNEIVPMVEENEGNINKTWDLYSKLLKDRIVMLNNEVKTLITDTILLYSQDRITQSNIDEGTANLKQAMKLLKDNSDDIYIIELNKFNIKNDNTDGYDTTTGINLALLWAKENGYKKVRLPQGEYSSPCRPP